MRKFGGAEWNGNFESLEMSLMGFWSVARELWAYMRAHKKLWMLPIIAVLLLVSSLLILAQGSALAPFIYTIF